MQGNTEFGFFKSLFDFQLRHFITLKVLRVLNIISVIWHIAFGTIVILAGLFGGYATGAEKFFLVIGTPIATLLLLIISRLWIEFLANLYRIGDNTQTMVDNLPSKLENEGQ
jgi:hypothetical protein